MIACFLAGELSSERFGAAIRAQLAATGHTEQLLMHPDLSDDHGNRARRAILATTRGYGERRELFDADFPVQVHWAWLRLTAAELERVRYMDYSYWIELSRGSRLPLDAVKRIHNGEEFWGVSHQRFLTAAQALAIGATFPPLILVGERSDDLVCLEGRLRLTAYALAGFPAALDCLVGTAPDMGASAH